MTLLGKIFTGLIVIMSVLFLGLAISVYATHVNWREQASELKQELTSQEQVNRKLKERRADLKSQVALEQAARSFALAELETKYQTRSEELEGVQQEKNELTATVGTTASALETAQSELTNITAEVETLRETVQAAHRDADAKFAKASELTDEVNQMRRVKDNLEKRQEPLQQQVAGLKDAMDKVGVSVDIRPDGTVRTDVDRIPPDVKGEVLAVGVLTPSAPDVAPELENHVIICEHT
ncbi:MAG: hypothetical protein R6U98_30390, partial [Pirellulaceae bacterium]